MHRSQQVPVEASPTKHSFTLPPVPHILPQSAAVPLMITQTILTFSHSSFLLNCLVFKNNWTEIRSAWVYCTNARFYSLILPANWFCFKSMASWVKALFASLSDLYQVWLMAFNLAQSFFIQVGLVKQRKMDASLAWPSHHHFNFFQTDTLCTL